jgi:predicted transcriptional regulator
MSCSVEVIRGQNAQAKRKGDVTVREMMSDRLFACSPHDEVHIALQRMQEGGVRRLPAIEKTERSYV